jgi:hypothetical protein
MQFVNALQLYYRVCLNILGTVFLLKAFRKFNAIALMMEAVKTFETSVNVYQTTRCYNPEDSHLRTHRRENLKSYLLLVC